MGQRANLVVVESRKFDLYYSHWCANTLPRDLFWGPAHAEAFIRLQRHVGDEGWLDTVWAEGGAVIDKPNRTLLLFGGEDISFDVPLRRLYLKLLSALWRNWRILWAHEGIVDIAEYVGLPRQRVLAAGDEEIFLTLEPPKDPAWTSSVASFASREGIYLYPLQGFVENYVLGGPTLCDQCARQHGHATLSLAEWTTEFPTGGFHVDTVQTTVDFWVAHDCPGLVNAVRSRWPGWSVTWHKDVYESQRDLTRNALIFNAASEGILAERLRNMLMVESKAVDILGIPGLLDKGEASKIEINPYALRDDRLSIGEDERRSILASAFSKINMGD